MEAGVPIKILGWATLRVHKSANRAFLQFSVQLQLLKQRSFLQYLAIQPRAFHKLPEIFQRVSPLFLKKVLESCLKNNQKLLFVTKVAQKLFHKTKSSFWSEAKRCKLYNKSKISKHFCAILRRNMRC